MLVLVSYDVSTLGRQGQTRLRRISKACLDYGQRVQNSVFECDIDMAQWTELKARLVELINPEEDSLRFYYLGNNWERRVEHVGAKPTKNLREDPLIV